MINRDDADGCVADVERGVEDEAPRREAVRLDAAITGVLVGIADDGRSPLVVFAGQAGTAAVRARTTVDLHGAHVGRQVVLLCERGDPARPIVMGVLQPVDGWPLGELPGRVEVDADGARLVLSANEQLVLKCGKASITLTKSGKVLIQGAYVSSRSSGVNRIKGGSVQLN
jgi:phage baseplate assembly protein gpV